MQQEMRLTDAAVLCSIMKWCWSRVPGGVVGWSVYEGFEIGEKESGMARNAFETFVPISADSQARRNIIFDFFDLLAAVAAHGKNNGLGGRKLSRLAGWWAFELSDNGKGFEGGYRSWEKAADATSHLFFAYLRSLSPDTASGPMLIERIPRSLQALLGSTEYPPETPTLLQRSTPKVVMIVDKVSPTPFALLRRARHFEYRSQDQVLREFSEFEDPLDALTDECKRVLQSISTTNSSAAKSRHRTTVKPDESWSAFSNMGFSDMGDSATPKLPNSSNGSAYKGEADGLRSQPRSRATDHARPTTPSWADFLSSGFNEDDVNTANANTFLLPPDKVLPPINSRAQSPAHVAEGEENLAPGELAAINDILLDDAFWWVWMTSLAGEESADRKAVFGRCALIETSIMHGKWLIMEEQIKGASPDPDEGVFIAPKKSFLSTLTKRARLGRKRSTRKEPAQEPAERVTSATTSKSNLAPDQQSKIKQAAAALKRQDTGEDELNARRGRHDDAYSTKTNSMMTMGLQTEASPAMKWASAYDKSTIRAQYLGDAFAGRGISRENLLPSKPSSVNLTGGDRASSINAAPAPALSPEATTFSGPDKERELPPTPQESQATPSAMRQSPPPTILPPQESEQNDLPSEVEKDKQQAESVPLPEAAMEKELAVGESASNRNTIGRKPVASNHPALRQTSTNEENAAPQTPTSPTQRPAALAAQRAMETSPESNKSGHAKLKKQGGAAGGGGGLKKLFGRKKDNPNRQSTTVNGNSSLAPPSEEPTRRLSLMRKKKPTPAQQAAPVPAPVPEPEPAAPSPASELEAEPVLPTSNGHYDQSDTNVSRIDPRDQAQAETEFSRFDQGPLDDMPAVTPQGEENEIIAPQAQRHHSTGLAARLADRGDTDSPNFVTPMERTDPIEDDDREDVQSEATMEDRPEVAQAAEKDRWATIRENAARRAARASEEQSESRPSQSARTDDGETSGEESKFIVFGS